MLIEAPADDYPDQPQQDKTMTSRKERGAGTPNTAFPEHTMRWILAKTVSLGEKMSKQKSVLNSFLIPKAKYTFVS